MKTRTIQDFHCGGYRDSRYRLRFRHAGPNGDFRIRKRACFAVGCVQLPFECSCIAKVE